MEGDQRWTTLTSNIVVVPIPRERGKKAGSGKEKRFNGEMRRKGAEEKNQGGRKEGNDE